ncbi:MAG: hypothetical protein ACKESA_00230, partial [Candidatus Hodgkinia cicadicola]
MAGIKLTIPSSKDILSWSYGEVYNKDLFNDKNNKPIMNGLFCPKIFGPINSYECLCEAPVLDKSSSCCDVCGVDLDISKDRARSRFGHIQLCAPIVHIWFYKSNPSILSVLLNKPIEYIQSLVNCELHIITSSLTDKYKIGQVINTNTYNKIWDQRHIYTVLSGGSAVLELLSKVQPEQLKKIISAKYKGLNSQKDLNDKLKIVNDFINNNMSSKVIINFLPVLPAPLRPTIMLPDNTYTSSDLNELYKNIIDVNNNIRLKLAMLRVGKTISFHEYISN